MTVTVKQKSYVVYDKHVIAEFRGDTIPETGKKLKNLYANLTLAGGIRIYVPTDADTINVGDIITFNDERMIMDVKKNNNPSQDKN